MLSVYLYSYHPFSSLINLYLSRKVTFSKQLSSVVMFWCNFWDKISRSRIWRLSLVHPTRSTNTHHDISLENHGNVENTKNWISQEQNMNFYEIKKFLICTCRGGNFQSVQMDMPFLNYKMLQNFKMITVFHKGFWK